MSQEIVFAKENDYKEINHLLKITDLHSEGIEDVDLFLVLKKDNRIIGCIGLEKYNSSGLLRSFAVHPEHQSQGFGYILLKKFLSEVKVTGIIEIYLLTLTAEKFFLKHGFTIISRDDVESEIIKSSQFQSLCPLTAITMYHKL